MSFAPPTDVLTVGDNTRLVYNYQHHTFTTSLPTALYWLFYTDDSSNIAYVTSPDGSSWSAPTEITTDGSGVQGTYDIWYDEADNLVFYARTYANIPQLNVFYGVGVPQNNGTIVWSIQEASFNGISGHESGTGISVFGTSGPIMFVGLSSATALLANFVEVWYFNGVVWANKRNTAEPAGAATIPILTQTTSGLILATNQAPFISTISFYYSSDNGTIWQGPVSTSGLYDIYLTGWTAFGDTIYLASPNGSVDIPLVSYTFGSASVDEESIDASPYTVTDAGVTTEGINLYFVFTDEVTTVASITYLNKVLNPGSATVGSVTVISNTETAANTVQIDEQSYGTALLAWSNNDTLRASLFSVPPVLITPSSDSGYGRETISVVRLPATPPASGAVQVTGQDTDYAVLSYQQQIDTVGIPITYMIQNITGTTTYEHPIITYTNIPIQAVLTIIGNDQYEYVETGFLPVHYANMWANQVQPQIGDRVLWEDIVWEVRNSIPKVLGGQVIYYQTLLRRVLSTGTLQSGGVQNPPTGDP